MMTVQQIRTALADRRPGLVANATGLSRQTVTQIRDGETKDPAFSVVKALSDYLESTMPKAGG